MSESEPASCTFCGGNPGSDPHIRHVLTITDRAAICDVCAGVAGELFAVILGADWNAP